MSISSPNNAVKTPKAPTRKRSFENFALNVLLYVGALLLVGAAALLLATASSPVLSLAALLLGTILFYASGISTYLWVPKLRLASYSFTATGIALIPLTGLAVYRMVYHDGPVIWLMTSLVGTGAILLGTALMRVRAMAYLIITFLVSDTLSATKVLDLPLIWYFIALLALATVLGLFLRAFPRYLPTPITRGFLDASRIFVPVTSIAALALNARFELWELAVIFALASVYSCVFLRKPVGLWIYLQFRLYPLLAVSFAALYVFETSRYEHLSFVVFDAIAVVLALSALAILFFKLSIEPISYLQDTGVTLAGSLLATCCGIFGHLFFLGRYATPETSARGSFSYFWALPKNGEGMLLPAWIIPVVLILVLACVAGKLPFKTALILISTATVLTGLPLLYAGLPFVLLSSALAFWVLSQKSATLRAVLRVLSISLAVLACLIAVWLSVPALDSGYIALIFAICVSALGLWQAVVLSRVHSVGNTLFPQTLVWILVTVTGFSTMLIASRRENMVGALETFEFTLTSAALTLAVAIYLSLTMIAVFLLAQALVQTEVSEHPQKPFAQTPAERLSNIFVAHGSWLVAVVLSFVFGFNLLLSLVIIGLLAVLHVVLPRLIPDIPLIFCSVCARVLVVIAALDILVQQDFSEEVLIDALLTIGIVLSLASWFMYDRGSASSRFPLIETILGLVFLGFSLLISIGSFTVEADLSVISTLYVAVAPLLPALLWWKRKKETCDAFLGLALANAFMLGVPYLLRVADAEPAFLFNFEMGLIAFALAKLLVAGFPHFYTQPQNFRQQASLWGRFNTPGMILALLLSLLIALLITNTFINDWWAAAQIIILTALWCLQVPASFRAPLAVIGTFLAIIRVMVAVSDFPAGLVLSEFTVLVLIISGLVPRSSKLRGRKQAVPYLWWAFAVQALTTLWFVPASFIYSWVSIAFFITVSVVLVASSSYALNKTLIISSAVLITVQVLWLLGSLNAITLFILGAILIGLVIWRLLSRSDDEPANSAAFARPSTDASPVIPWAKTSSEQVNQQAPTAEYGYYPSQHKPGRGSSRPTE